MEQSVRRGRSAGNRGIRVVRGSLECDQFQFELLARFEAACNKRDVVIKDAET